jgi:ABC-2 type transport system permease protein
MRKTLLVLKYEFLTTLSRPSWLFVVFGVPLITILIVTVLNIVKTDSAGAGIESDATDQFELRVEGYVDQSGLVSSIPEDIPPDHLLVYEDETSAHRALESEEITAYYIIPEDYVETGELFYIYPDATPLTSGGQDWLMRRTLLINLLEGDSELADLVWNPMMLEATSLAPESEHDVSSEEDCSRPGFTCESSPLVRYLPSAMVALFYVFLMTASGLLLRNISTEKENRLIEILMASVTPREMLWGKIIGLGLVGLIQVITWVGTIFFLSTSGGQTLQLPDEFTLPISLLMWALAFFLLGYVVYASLMAGLGALVPNLRETGQATWVVMAPLLVGYVIGLFSAIEAPHGMLPILLSMFPLTAPVVMMMRLTVGGVPTWQIVVSAGLMLVTALGIVRAVAAMFHAQNLLSGQPFSARRFFREILGRS